MSNYKRFHFLQVAKEAFEKIGAKVALEINHWDRENHVVHGIKDKIVKVFKRDFELMEGQIAKLEGNSKGSIDTHVKAYFSVH